MSQIHAPIVNSPDYLPNTERFEKDFASYDKQVRAQKMADKQEHLERRRHAAFDRDMKRWEFMENYEKLNDRREEIRRGKYQCGKITGSGNGYNIMHG